MLGYRPLWRPSQPTASVRTYPLQAESRVISSASRSASRPLTTSRTHGITGRALESVSPHLQGRKTVSAIFKRSSKSASAIAVAAAAGSPRGLGGDLHRRWLAWRLGRVVHQWHPLPRPELVPRTGFWPFENSGPFENSDACSSIRRSLLYCTYGRVKFNILHSAYG